MTLRRIVKISDFFKTLSSYQLIRYTENYLNPQNPIGKTQSRKTHDFFASDTISKLIAIFTKRPLIGNSEELKILVNEKEEELKLLGGSLNTGTVEAVLKGLTSWKIACEFFSWAAEQDGYRHNCYAYNAMATILSRAGKPKQLKVLAMDIVNSMCSMTPGALGFFIRCLGNHGLTEEAIYIFDQTKKLGLCSLNSYTYNCLLEALAKAKQVELVETRLKEMKDSGWNPDKFTLTPVLQAYCSRGRFKEALLVFDQIHNQGWLDEHVLTILVMSFSKWGEVDKAFELMERMEYLNVNLNEKTMCLLVHGFTRASRVDKALLVFEKMGKMGFTSDLPLYSVLIEGLCKNKELSKALDLYEEMKTCEICPDVGIIMQLISSFCAAADFITANHLLEEGEKGLQQEARILLYNTVLQGLVDHGLVEKAYLLIRAMMGVGNGEVVIDGLFKVRKEAPPNLASFSIVINGLCKAGKLDLALDLFGDMTRNGCQKDVILYNNLIKELCISGRVEEGLQLWREMKESGYNPTAFTYNCLFGGLCEEENVPGLLVLMKEMRSRGHEPWIKHTSVLVKQLCEHGKVVQACEFLRNMVQEGFLPSIIAYAAAIDGLFKIEEADQAMELFRDIFARGYRPDLVAYNILIRGLCKSGRISEALEFFEKMLEEDIAPSFITYNLMIDGLCKINEIDEALSFFKRMANEARVPNVVTYTTLLDGLCAARRPNDALLLWDEMREKGLTPNKISYMALIHGLCNCSKTDEALVYFHEMKKNGMVPETYLYVALISGFMSSGKLLLAFEILKEMVRKRSFPSQLDKNYPIILDAVHKLSDDPSTSLGVKNLIAEGCIPAICGISRNGIEIDKPTA